MKSEDEKTRRDFMRSIVRGGAFGVLGAMGFILGRRSVMPGQECVGQYGYCRACDKRNSCGLPAAVSARSAEGALEKKP